MERSREALWMAAALSIVAAFAHVWAAPGHFGELWGYGSFFLVVACVQGLYGLGLLRRPSRAFLVLGAVGNFGIVFLYVLTRARGVPFLGRGAVETQEKLLHGVSNVSRLRTKQT